ncbi:hypothetical protein [Frondihabitans australicus]|uniref:DUF7882 domain-containing protein n=1 Tax=Frondihabitans australicus TaxID=386892 RepID=A0A495IDS4_9MICO|nr:hypothetical protein [Frondihabitans australicus]RKR73285.1 hypothetical protein C8E83_0376 [Frondihabitans australicus]
MGRLVYGGEQIEFDDRTLLHLQLLVASKLQRHECFFLNWRVAAQLGGGRASIWLAAGVPVAFHFDSANPGPVNTRWLSDMTKSPSSDAGPFVVVEPEPAPTDSPTEGTDG